MENKKDILERLIEYRTKITTLKLSETAIEKFVLIVRNLISYLTQLGSYRVTIDGLEQDIIMVDRNIKLGWKPGTQGEKHFNNCKRDVLTTLGYVISGAEQAVNIGDSSQ